MRRKRKRKLSGTISSLYAANSLLLTFTTSPIDDAAAAEGGATRPAVPGAASTAQNVKAERVVALFEGMTIHLTISGTPGRYVRVLYNTQGENGSYRPYPGQTARIGSSGKATLRFNMSGFQHKVAYFKVATAATLDFRSQLQHSEPATLEFSGRRISHDFGGSKYPEASGFTRGLEGMRSGEIRQYAPEILERPVTPRLDSPAVDPKLRPEDVKSPAIQPRIAPERIQKDLK